MSYQHFFFHSSVGIYPAFCLSIEIYLQFPTFQVFIYAKAPIAQFNQTDLCCGSGNSKVNMEFVNQGLYDVNYIIQFCIFMDLCDKKFLLLEYLMWHLDFRSQGISLPFHPANCRICHGITRNTTNHFAADVSQSLLYNLAKAKAFVCLSQ